MSEVQQKSLKFEARSKDPFSVELHDEVEKYFSERKRSKKGSLLLWAKALFYLGGLGFLYSSLFLFPLSAGQALLVFSLMGMFCAGIGFNVGHDALHDAYSKKSWVNDLMGHSYTLLGANVYNWKILHNKIHHTYTNVEGADGDLETVKFLRFYEGKEGYRFYHRFQHLYAPFFYALTSLVWVFKKDFDHIHKPQHMLFKKPELPRGEFARLIFCKLFYLMVFIGLPALLSPLAVGSVLLGFLLLHFVQGLCLAFTFQLGHLVEGPDVIEMPKSGKLPSWHVLQLQGTSNFGTLCPLSAWLFGGLNQQVEHHLFPKISHVHYPALSKIVKRLANKYGHPYHEHKTFFHALRSHFRLLKKLGTKPLPQEATLASPA